MLKKKKKERESERSKVGEGGKGAGEENEISAKGLRIHKSDLGTRGTWRGLWSPQGCLQALRFLKSTSAFNNARYQNSVMGQHKNKISRSNKAKFFPYEN